MAPAARRLDARSRGDGIAAGRGGVDYLLGGDGGLLFSRSGGDAGRASR